MVVMATWRPSHSSRRYGMKIQSDLAYKPDKRKEASRNDLPCMNVQITENAEKSGF